MKLTLLSLLLAIFFSRSCGQIMINNAGRIPIQVCIGWYEKTEEFKGFVTKGWYSVVPGQTAETEIPVNPPPTGIFYYIKNSKANSASSYFIPFLVGKSNFLIRNADMEYVKQQNISYSWRYFQQVSLFAESLQGIGKKEKFRYTLYLK